MRMICSVLDWAEEVEDVVLRSMKAEGAEALRAHTTARLLSFRGKDLLLCTLSVTVRCTEEKNRC
jgi:hypothetical protein